MPIGRSDFDAGGQAATPVVDFLRQHADQAYTFSELMEQFAENQLTSDHLDWALRTLEEKGSIDVRLLQNRVYYSYRAPIGFRLRERSANYKAAI
jgi:DNA-binding HxlR family transcriptional regulator